MRRSLSRNIFIFLLWLLTGCGNVFVGFVSNPQIPSSSTVGKIAEVNLGTVNDANGNPLTITAVTLVQNGLASTSSFCGDQRTRFPLNQIVKIDFVKETECLFLVNVVVID